MFSHENRRAYGLVARRTFDPANLGKGKESSPARLDLHLIVDHYGTHPHPRVESWLVRHPRFHLHGIPTSSSWLNLVERCFRDITDQRWRRGTLENVRALVRSITDYLDNPNQNPKAFVWTASVEAILRKITINKEAHCCPVKSRRESTGCDLRVKYPGSQMLPRPVKLALFQKE